MSSGGLLFKNATVISMDPEIGIVTGCDVLIEGNTISKVKPGLSAAPDIKVIDASDSIIAPGFVDAHHHLWQQLLKGVATDWTLADYMSMMRRLYGSLFTPEDVYAADFTACLDLIANGITTVIDHCHILNSPSHTDAAIKALKDSGIRGTFCYGFYENVPLGPQHSRHDTVNPDFDTKAKMDDAVRAKQTHFPRNDPSTDLITFGLAPNEPEAWPIEDFLDEIKFARKIGCRVITAHVGMGNYDLGKQVVQQVEAAGLLKSDCLWSHGHSFTQKEIEHCAANGCGIVSTPETDLMMGMGFPVAFRAHDGGCEAVGLGLDITSNQNQDFFVQMRQLLNAERARVDAKNGLSTNIPRKSMEALYFATLGGARAIRLDHLIGSITPGKRADMIMVSCKDVNVVPVTNPIGCLLHYAGQHNIDTVLVDGKALKQDGQLQAGQWEEMRDDIRQRSARIVHAAQDISPEGTKMDFAQFGAAKK